MDPEFEWGVTRINPSMFRNILEFLNKDGYTTISIQTLSDPKVDLPKKPIVLTFDDSFESIYNYAMPIMDEFGFKGTVFVITGFVGKANDWDVNFGWKKFRHLSWDQICQLKKKGFKIGSHTVNHPDLTRMSNMKIMYELEKSKAEIEDKTGYETSYISFPFGRYNTRVLDLCREFGYAKGCTLCCSFKNRRVKDPFVLERKVFYFFDRIINLKAKLNETFLTPFENVKLRIVNICSYGTSLVKPVK